MKPHQIGKAYDQIADLWDRARFNNENGIPQHRRAIAFTKKHGAALDVGCGWNGRFIDLLLEQVLRKLLASLDRGGVVIFSTGGLDDAYDHTDDYP